MVSALLVARRSRFGSFLLPPCPPQALLMAVRPRLDDPAALTARLDQLGAPAAVRSALAAKGFSSLSSLAFALADPSDPAQVKLFLKALLGLPDDDDSGFVSADASCVRRLLLEASSPAPARPANPSAAGPSLPSPGSSAASSKLQPADLAHLKREFTAKYRASSSLPSRRHPPWSFSLCSSSMGRRLRLGGFLGACVADAARWEESRKPRNDRHFLRQLLDSESEPPAPSVNVNVQGPAEPVVRRALHLFATALAMLDLVHLATIKKFNERFLDLALRPPIDPTLRPPSLQERSGRLGLHFRAHERPCLVSHRRT